MTTPRTAWQVFRREIEAAERYERGLLRKTGLVLLIVTVVAVLRETFLI